jgi:hypothetical protein
MPKRIRSEEYLALQRKYTSEKAMCRKLKAIIELGGKCVHCGLTACLELDHIDRSTKSFPISRPPSEKAFREELKKCQVLCRWCHREKSTKEHQGDNCPHAKLTGKQVKEIKELLKLGKLGTELAKEYGVCPMQISRIKNGKRWQHLE